MDAARTRDLLASLDSVQAEPDDDSSKSSADTFTTLRRPGPTRHPATIPERTGSWSHCRLNHRSTRRRRGLDRGDAPDRVADDPNPAESPVETDTTEQSAEQAAVVAEQFTAAGDAADVEASLALIDPEARLTVGNNVVAPEEKENWIRLEGVLGFRDEEAVCSASDPTQVECSTNRSNRWTDATGGEPEPNTFFLRIQEGQVTAMSSTAVVDGWEEYVEFVMERSSDEEFAAMFVSHPDGMGIIGLAYTDESTELHPHWTDEFEAAQGD